MADKTFSRLVTIVQAAAFCVFLGRAWQHLFWDAPFRDLLWDERWMKWIIESLFGITWQEYLTNPEYDSKIQTLIKSTGWFYLLCAIACLFIRNLKTISGVIMVMGSISLIFLAALYCKEKFFSLGQFFEYSLQFSTPVFLLLLVRNGAFDQRLIFFIKITIALTFACHGLYAINYYPRPGEFTDMTINILGISETNALRVLNLAGILDFVIAIAIFFPFRVSKYILAYAILWGVATTFARICANVYLDFFWSSLHQWWFEAAYRSPHFLIPLALFLFYNNEEKRPANG